MVKDVWSAAYALDIGENHGKCEHAYGNGALSTLEQGGVHQRLLRQRIHPSIKSFSRFSAIRLLNMSSPAPNVSASFNVSALQETRRSG